MGFMKIRVGDSDDIEGIMAEVEYAPADDIVLMLIVAADRAAEHLIHKQASVFARAGKIGWNGDTSLGSLFAPFTKHKNFGLSKTFIGIGKLRLPVYSPIGHFRGLRKAYVGPP